MPDDSRIWIYQSNRTLDTQEVEIASAVLLNFTEQWTAHQNNLKASFTILYNRFVVLAVDEKAAGASGCSIDSSVRVLRQLQDELDIDLFNRTLVYYKAEEDYIDSAEMSDFKAMLANGDLTADTLVFNNMIQQINQLETEWEVPVSKSWHKQMLPAD
jgi:hypothetical protein